MPESNGKKYVTWTVFVFVVSITIGVMGVLYGISSSALSGTQDTKTDVAVIKNTQELQYQQIIDRIDNLMRMLESGVLNYVKSSVPLKK